MLVESFLVTHKTHQNMGLKKFGKVINAVVNYRGDAAFIVEVELRNERGSYIAYEVWSAKDCLKGNLNEPVEPKPSVEDGKVVEAVAKENKKAANSKAESASNVKEPAKTNNSDGDERKVGNAESGDSKSSAPTASGSDGGSDEYGLSKRDWGADQ